MPECVLLPSHPHLFELAVRRFELARTFKFDEGVIKVVVTDLRQLYTTDSYGTAIDDIPIRLLLRLLQSQDDPVAQEQGVAERL